MIGVQVHDPVVPQGPPLTELRQFKPEQQGLACVQVCPTDPQVDDWQVPVDEPVGTTQVVPLQQSALTLQIPP